MDNIKRVVAPAGTVMGPIVAIVSTALDGLDLVTLGFPLWVWQVSGGAIFFASVMAVLYGHIRQTHDSQSDEVPATVTPDSANQSIRQHFSNTEEMARAKELLEFEQTQRQSWLSFVHLRLCGVDCSHVNEASPYVVLDMELRNFLLVPVRLLNAMNSDGTVDVHTLPSLPENYDVTVQPCLAHLFQIKLAIHGTDVPNHLRSEASVECRRPLRWVIRGEWYVEVFGTRKRAWTRSYELRCNAVVNLPSSGQ